MFGNMDATVNRALAEAGFSADGRPPGQPPVQTGNAQAAFAAPGAGLPVQAQIAAGLPSAGHRVGQLANRALQSPLGRIAGALPVAVGGLAVGGIVLGALWLSRRMEHRHVRLDTPTIAPVLAAVVVGAVILWVLRRVRDLHETAKLLDAASQVSLPAAAAAAPNFAAPPGTMMGSPGAETPESALAEAQRLLAGTLT